MREEGATDLKVGVGRGVDVVSAFLYLIQQKRDLKPFALNTLRPHYIKESLVSHYVEIPVLNATLAECL